MIALIGSALIARHNLRLGRGDVSGALRIGFVYFVIRLLSWLFETHHNGSVKTEFLLLLSYLSSATFTAFYLWLLYIALEPFLRRRWPHRIISWTRLLRGEFRDPLVGRHILIGVVCGAVIILLSLLTPSVMLWLGIPFDLATNPGATLLGSRFFLRLSGQAGAALFVPFMMFFLLLLFVTIFRNEWVSLGLLWIVLVILNTLVAGGSLSLLPAAALAALIVIVLLYRYGLLALVAAVFVAYLAAFYPVTTEFRAWYAIDFVIGALLCVALTTYAFYMSLAGQKLFAGNLFED
jgi:serine/threonine-protein kinase